LNNQTIAGKTNTIESFDLQVDTAGESFKKTFDLDAHTNTVIGVNITSDYDNLMFYRGSLRLSINDLEVLPEGFEAKLLMTGLNVSPNERYLYLNRESGNNRIELRYQDTAHTNTNFSPYRVTLYIYGSREEAMQ